MNRCTDYLLRWAEIFFKNRDIMTRKIVSMRRDDDSQSIEVVYKDKTSVLFANEFLKKMICDLKEEDREKDIVLIIFNTEENFSALLEKWNDIIGFTKLAIYFINPDSLNEPRWIIRPYIHNKIAEDNIEQGLRSLFETVDIVTPSGIKRIINNA